MKPWKKEGKVKWEAECDMIDFTCELFDDSKFCCVYILNFSSGKFYIGSTEDYHQRVWIYRNNFHSRVFEMKGLALASEECDYCRMSVLFKCSPSDRLLFETKAIEARKSDLNMINRSRSGFGNNKIVWTQSEKDSISKTMTGIKKSPEHRANMGCKPSPFKYRRNEIFEDLKIGLSVDALVEKYSVHKQTARAWKRNLLSENINS